METRSRVIRKIRADVLLAVLLLTGTLRAGINIMPAYVEVNLESGRPTGVFYISNIGKTEERYRINAIHVNHTEGGAMLITETGQFSLAPWVRFNPREVTIAPGTRRAVRFAILVPREKLAPGEWWGAMEMESLTVGQVATQTSKGTHTVSIEAITKILVPIFGTVGKPSYEGQIKDLQVQIEKGQVVLKAMVASTGTGRLGVKGSEYIITDAEGKVVDSGLFATGYVFRGGQRWFKKQIEAAIPPGPYTVTVSLPAAHLGQPLTHETQVVWPEAPVQAGPIVGPSAPPAAEEPQDTRPTDGDKQSEVQGSAGSQ